MLEKVYPTIGILLASLMLGSCGSSGSNSLPPDEVIVGLASVESVKVFLRTTVPGGYFADVEGFLPDPCHELQEPMIELVNRTYEVRLETLRPAELICPQVLEPFEINFELPSGFPRVFDRVIVNGVEGSFANFDTGMSP